MKLKGTGSAIKQPPNRPFAGATSEKESSRTIINAADCRRDAETCFEQTKKVRDPSAKARYFELTMKWLALAREIEAQSQR